MANALRFLTILPVPGQAGDPGPAAAWFPLVGILLGLLATAMMLLPFGPLLALLTLTLATGALHEDGLADVFDAIRAGRTRERMHQILKDSRIGTHGAVALLFSVLLRWQALEKIHGHLLPPELWFRLPVAWGVSRAAMVLLAAASKPAGDGLGASFVRSISGLSATVAAVQALAFLGILARFDALAAVSMLGVNLALLIVLRGWFHTRLGGVTGDCLGCACQISEAASLMVLAWR